jgi:hypothetical protein
MTAYNKTVDTESTEYKNQCCLVIWIFKASSIPVFLSVSDTEDLLVVWKNQNQRTASLGYFKTLKEPPGFMKESVVFWRLFWFFQILENHDYVPKLVFGFFENCS